MKKTITLIAFLCTCSCAVLKEAQENLMGGKSYVGENENAVLARYGAPKSVRKTPEGDKIIYFNHQWYRAQNGVVVSEGRFGEEVFKVEVKSFFDDSFKEKLNGRTFAIYSGMPNVQTNDLEFQEASRALAHILSLNGLNPTSANNPTYVFLISYGISEPIEDIDITYRPTFAWVPSQSTSTSGRVGGVNFSSTSTSPGYAQHTGYAPKVEKSTSYKRYLIISAYENTTDLNKSRQIWKTSLQSSGYSSDLQKVLGAMFGLAQDWAFKATGGREITSVPVNDPMTKLAFPK